MITAHVPHTLRDYQRDGVDAIKQAWQSGCHAPLVAVATGGGKTTMMAQLLVETVEPDLRRALVIAHTKEIVEQIYHRIENQYAGRLSEWFGGVKMYPGIGMVMGQHDLPQARVVVATRQSLHKSRLAQVIKYGAFDVVVIDEAHHAVADNTYGEILNHVRRVNKNVKLVGFTATPKRADKKALKTIFDDIVYQWLIPDGIQSSYLTPVTRLKVKTKVDLSNIRNVGGDYSQKKMVGVLNVANWVDLTVEAYNRYVAAANRQCLAYLPSVAMSKAFSDRLQHSGIAAAHVDGKTAKDEREQILRDYINGTLSVVSNMAVLTEGFDAPTTDAILLARPTRSQTLFTQIVGRGLRPADGKQDCLLVDMTVVDTKALEIGTLLGRMIHCDQCPCEYDYGLPCCPQCGADVPKAKREANEDNESQLPNNMMIGSELIAEHAEMFEKALAAWHVGNDGYISCTLSFDAGSLLIMPPMIDDFYRLVKVPKSRDDNPTIEYQNSDLNEVMMWGETLVKKYGTEQAAMKNAVWRSGDASRGQVKLLKKLGIENAQGMTKGMAARLITHHIAVQRIEESEGLQV
jgi:superfamily II DNA or RNA helicase